MRTSKLSTIELILIGLIVVALAVIGLVFIGVAASRQTQSAAAVPTTPPMPIGTPATRTQTPSAVRQLQVDMNIHDAQAMPAKTTIPVDLVELFKKNNRSLSELRILSMQRTLDSQGYIDRSIPFPSARDDITEAWCITYDADGYIGALAIWQIWMGNGSWYNSFDATYTAPRLYDDQTWDEPMSTSAEDVAFYVYFMSGCTNYNKPRPPSPASKKPPKTVTPTSWMDGPLTTKKPGFATAPGTLK